MNAIFQDSKNNYIRLPVDTVLYHGTSNIHLNSIKEKGLIKGTWLTNKLHHAFKLAERTSKRDGGKPTVIRIKPIIGKIIFDKVTGRDIPTFRYYSGEYNIIGCVVYGFVLFDESKD